MKTPEQLKGQIRSFAVKHKLMSQELLQMYLFERVLERLAASAYKDNFILKGGLLISSMLGIHERTTMDMDTTVTGITMDETEIAEILKEVLTVDVSDGIVFEYKKIEPIRENDDYYNFRVHFNAVYGKIRNPMKIDITTGDQITPAAIEYKYRCIFDNVSIPVKAYTPETIIAEKYETIIRRNIGTTRARDFYDLLRMFGLYKERISPTLLRQAVNNTSRKRGSEEELSEWRDICREMRDDTGLQRLWENYTQTNEFAREMTFAEVLNAVEDVGTYINE